MADNIVAARAVVSMLAVEELGCKGTEVGAVLGLGRSGVTRAVARGRRVAATCPGLRDEILAKEQPENK